CCTEHPYHSVWQLLNIVNTVHTSLLAQDRERKAAAQKIISYASVKKKEVCSNMAKLSRSMINLAKVPAGEAHHLIFQDLPGNIGQIWLKDIPSGNYVLPTYDIKPREVGGYSDIPTVSIVEDVIPIAGGISRPKIISFILSNGEKTRIILKSESRDDLRQDAIVQQVLKVANTLLQKENRNLGIITYIVAPLASTIGAIQFAENSKSLQDVLAPLHKTYGGVNEYSKERARSMMKRVSGQQRTIRIETFREIMEHTQPQMRHFWSESHLNIQRWFKAKNNWSRTNGVMSIMGYILGLGDRHASNLLLNTYTGEVIHIDFGITFD
ncbi:hypothetical protein FF38_03749, partial [Lucilia cuprina]